MSIIEIENDWGLVHRYEFATLPAQRRCPVILSKMEGIASRAGVYAALSALWCNGSTADSESACLGSNPSEAAMLAAEAFREGMAHTRDILWRLCFVALVYGTPLRTTPREGAL